VHWVFAAAAYERQPPPPLTPHPHLPPPILHCFCVSCMGGEVRNRKV
jgi:hypothetical protein